MLESADSVDLAVDRGHLFARTADLLLAVKLIDSGYPPYHQVIPTSHSTEIVMDRAALLASLRRAQLLASDVRGVRLSAGAEGLRLSCAHPDMGEITEDLDGTREGKDVVIGVNAKYVVDVLSALDVDQVRIEMAGELEPVVIRPLSGDGYLAVVMPMRT